MVERLSEVVVFSRSPPVCLPDATDALGEIIGCGTGKSTPPFMGWKNWDGQTTIKNLKARI
jgi:hypothetical protein